MLLQAIEIGPPGNPDRLADDANLKDWDRSLWTLQVLSEHVRRCGSPGDEAPRSCLAEEGVYIKGTFAATPCSSVSTEFEDTEGDGALRALHLLIAWLRKEPVGGRAAAARLRLRARLVSGFRDACGAPPEDRTWPPPAAVASMVAEPPREFRRRLVAEARKQVKDLLGDAADEAVSEEASGYCVRCLAALLEDLPTQAARADAVAGATGSAELLSRTWARLRGAEEPAVRQSALKALASIAGLRLLEIAAWPQDEEEARLLASTWASLLLQEAETAAEPRWSVCASVMLTASMPNGETDGDQKLVIEDFHTTSVERLSTLASLTQECFLEDFGHDEVVAADCFIALGAIEEAQRAKQADEREECWEQLR